MDAADYDSNVVDALIALYLDDQLEGVAAGIGAFAQGNGGSRLSDKQYAVAERAVDQFCRTHSCAVCGNMERDDVVQFLESGCCSYHTHVLSKDD